MLTRTSAYVINHYLLYKWCLYEQLKGQRSLTTLGHQPKQLIGCIIKTSLISTGRFNELEKLLAASSYLLVLITYSSMTR